ncbi:orotidine 5'-phosphate decarboxylase [Bacteroidales bacterium KA00251]|nr:orotidine 5'-phosphate decarboxylase [Bacteroidales bacterium KA00251]
MNRQQLIENIKEKHSFLCVGLDTDVKKLPASVMEKENPMLYFNKAIIDATSPYCMAYKPNLAFYEAMGSYGIKVFEETVEYIKTHYPSHFVIADAKRGDIGNTSSLYARAYFEHFKADAITVAPYMGADSVKPFLEYPELWVILLALTSNQGSEDFQLKSLENGKPLFEEVIETATSWASPEHLMFVVGATKPKYIQRIRELAPDYFLLVPGIGAQGGDLETVANEGLTMDCGLIVNASRSIIYADNSDFFAKAAAKAAQDVQQTMERLLVRKGII